MQEEKLNAWTHAVGIVFAVEACVLLLCKCPTCDWQYQVGVVVFAMGALMQYVASTVYHFAENADRKARLRIFDHVSIYVLISASYTPVWLSVLGGVGGWIGFSVMWAVAIGGLVYKLLAIGKFPRLSLIIYLAMGWSVVFVAKPVWDATPAAGCGGYCSKDWHIQAGHGSMLKARNIDTFMLCGTFLSYSVQLPTLCFCGKVCKKDNNLVF